MSDSIERAAEMLLDARREVANHLKDLPETLRPCDEAAAYAIQKAVTDQLGPVVGWKVAPLKGGHSTCAALNAKLVVASPARVSSARFPMHGVEAEVAVKLGRDLPVREAPYTREEVADAIAAFLPAIEVVQSRYLDSKAVSPLCALADHLSNGLLVVGTPVTGWGAIDLARESVVATADDKVEISHTGMPGGDLLGEVVWLANVGSRWDGGLLAGQVITCGAWGGCHRVGPQTHFVATFSHVGRVEMTFGQPRDDVYLEG